MNISNPLIEESLFDSTNKEDGKEIYTKDCHILPICKSYGQASYCCLAGAFVGKRCSYAEKMQIVIANDANPNATIKYPKLQLEVAHFLKIKLRKSYQVHSRIDHQVFCSLEFS